MRRNIDYKSLRGVRRYAALLRCLADSPKSNGDLAAVFGGAPSRMGCCTRGMSHLGLIHVVSWRTESKACSSPCRSRSTTHVRLYGIGPGADASRPSGKEYRRIAIRPNPDLIAFAALIRELRAPSSMRELQDECGLSRSVVTSQIAFMRSIGLVHIAGWSRVIGGGQPVPLYAVGLGKSDAARPKPLTRAQRRARHAHDRLQRSRFDALSRALARRGVAEALSGNASPLAMVHRAPEGTSA